MNAYAAREKEQQSSYLVVSFLMGCLDYYCTSFHLSNPSPEINGKVPVPVMRNLNQNRRGLIVPSEMVKAFAILVIVVIAIIKQHDICLSAVKDDFNCITGRTVT